MFCKKLVKRWEGQKVEGVTKLNNLKNPLVEGMSHRPGRKNRILLLTGPM